MPLAFAAGHTAFEPAEGPETTWTSHTEPARNKSWGMGFTVRGLLQRAEISYGFESSNLPDWIGCTPAIGRPQLQVKVEINCIYRDASLQGALLTSIIVQLARDGRRTDGGASLIPTHRGRCPRERAVLGRA
jgi:hypothetical protein